MEEFSTVRVPLQKKRGRKKRFAFVFLFTLFASIVLVVLFKSDNILTIDGYREDKNDIYANFEIEKEDNRIDILLLGIRGAADENGGLLADTIILASFDKEKEKAALISLPRDLFVEMPGYPKKEKINFAYALGEQRNWGGGGLDVSKEVVQYVSGVYVDYAAVVNFDGFVEFVDLLGGVQVYRDSDFVEAIQWGGEGREYSEYWYKGPVVVEDEGREEISDEEEFDAINDEEEISDEESWVFHVPKGTSTLDGEDTLYYVRSRFSSSDFERIKRQQAVVSSLKAKVLSLGILVNPVRVFNLIDALGNNIRTDMGLGDTREAISLAKNYSSTEIKSYSLDISDEGLLEVEFVDGQYVLVPKSGNLNEVRSFFRNIFED